ncbi:MAG TPA: electron transport complex subunit RsxG [Gammaproteobacteria bacterium]|nr:electron transport complex subunit RsxG [Gammaproteobacteria bacterium]
MIITTIILLLFALIGTALVVTTFDNTRERIAANERATLLRKLHQLILPEQHDNTLLEDTLLVTDKTLLGTGRPVTVYRARKASQPVALVITPIAPDGYSGSIKLLVGINADGTLSGVRVVAHRETPGLGDAIDDTRSNWIHIFDNRSLGEPPLERWGVKKDGGDFDQLTGATITPRAVVKAVRQALLYYRDNQEALFASSETGTPASSESDD